MGTDATGTHALPKSYDGVVIQNGAANSTSGGGQPSTPATSSPATLGMRVAIVGNGTTGNVVEGDYLGQRRQRRRHLRRASNNTIGGTTARAGDVLSASGQNGVYISDTGTTGNIVAGDLIGTDSTGLHALPNYDGVVIQNGAANNTIGGTTVSARDVISGNYWDGVHIVGGGTSGNVVEGDYLGVTASGSARPWATAPAA